MTISSTAPVIGLSGISAPSFEEILEFLQDQYREIFGSDIYLASDSQDGQWLALLAKSINDSNNAAVAIYNAFSPNKAQGEGLSSVVKINGIRRQLSTNSTVDVTLTGIAGTTVENGVVIDDNEERWFLPEVVSIAQNGRTTVTAVAASAGRVTALPGTVTRIATPTRGWQTVNNAAGASPGRNVETDAMLRRRQTTATELPSQSLMAGILSGVANIDGVTRYRGYENDTNEPDENGIPKHSISLVVEGGDAKEIAQLMARKKTLGTGTHGSTSVTATDAGGYAKVIQFYRPDNYRVRARVTVEALQGYLSITGDHIKQRVADYINALGIGRTIQRSRVFVPANLSNTESQETFDVIDVELAVGSDNLGLNDVQIPFNAVAECQPEDVEVIVQ